MFGWLKKLVGMGEKAPPPPPPSEAARSGASVSAETVADNFLAQNPAPTPWGVHALINAGGANLTDAAQLQIACDKIEEHGYQYPLNPTLRSELSRDELLEFLQWQANADVAKEAYQNEATIRALLDRYRNR